MREIAVVIVCVVSTRGYAQKFGGLATTPPMGWDSWNHVGCDVDEQLIRDTADAVVA